MSADFQNPRASARGAVNKLQRKAIAVCFTSDKVSVSEVQRKLSISYADAQTLCQSIVDLGLTDELELAPSLKQRGAPAPKSAPVARPSEDAVNRASLNLARKHAVYLSRESVRELLAEAAPVAQGDAEQRQMDAKHAAIYRWMLSNVAEAWNIINNWCLDAEAGTDELHDALAARAQAKEGDTK